MNRKKLICTLVVGVSFVLASFGIGLNLGETAEWALVGEFATPEVAQQAYMSIDGFIQVYASLMSEMPMPMMQTMKAGTGEAGTAWLKMVLSKTDLDIAEVLIKQFGLPGGPGGLENTEEDGE